MKLIIQIPCFNEEGQLPLTLSHLPPPVPGFDARRGQFPPAGAPDREALEV